MRAAFLFLWLISIGTLAGAVPVPKDKPGKTIKESPPPDLQAMIGQSNWGQLTQRGQEVFITGHPRWEATGRILKDGSILLAWTREVGASFEVCPASYNVEGNVLRGKWGYQGSAFVELDGTLSGATFPDTIYRID